MYCIMVSSLFWIEHMYILSRSHFSPRRPLAFVPNFFLSWEVVYKALTTTTTYNHNYWSTFFCMQSDLQIFTSLGIRKWILLCVNRQFDQWFNCHFPTTTDIVKCWTIVFVPPQMSTTHGFNEKLWSSDHLLTWVSIDYYGSSEWMTTPI